MATAQDPASGQGKVLLTGGTGFIASHVLDCLLDNGFQVVVTVRSAEKGESILQALDHALRARVSFVVVQDIAEEGAFDEAVKSEPPFDYVVHTASPFQPHFLDPEKDCLGPAIKGTTGILKATKAHAPSVKRVVITSSSAAILHPPEHAEVYDESHWSGVPWEEAPDPQNAYLASKKFAEKAAWAFMATEQPAFDLAVINNTYTFGPVQRTLASLDGVNTSNRRMRNMVLGRMRGAIEPTTPVFTFVDVRDVALAHVRALTAAQAGGKRFYVVAGFFSNARLAAIIRDNFPQLRERLPPAEQVVDDFPAHHWAFDNSRSREVLGLEYMALEKSVVDTVQSMVRFETALHGFET